MMASTLRERGDVSRYTTALLAVGAFMMFAGVAFVAPFLLSARAQENDVFLTNLFFAPVYYLIGSTLLILCFIALGLARRFAIILAIANPLGVIGSLWLVSIGGVTGYGALTVTLAVDAALLLGVSLLIALRSRHLGIWGEALTLAAGGAAIATLAYAFFGSRYLAFGETSSALPPYLDLPIIGVTFALATGVFVLGWVWKRR